MEWETLHHPATYIVALVGVITLVFYVGRWGGRMNHYKEMTLRFMGQIRQDVDELRSDIKNILGQIQTGPAVEGRSPLQLTEFGQAISQMLGTSKWAETIAEQLRVEVKDKEPYEIQDFAYDYVRNRFQPTPEQDHQIRNCAYEKGTRPEVIHEVLAIEIRNQLLAKQD